MEFWKPKEGEMVKIRFLPREESLVNGLFKHYRKMVSMTFDDCPFYKAGIPRKKVKQIK